MKAWRLLILGWLTTTIFGCSSPQVPPGSPFVPITTLEQIVGKWEGLSKRIPDMRNHAQVLLTISDTGRFNFVSDRGKDLLLGTGMVTISDGRALGKSGRGSGTITLYGTAGRPVIVLIASLNDGNHYYVEMAR